ncbi:MAG: OmpA family protein [Myxococcota bacterium]|nr:OmpA family protein [Myxococcota bacterium]
MLLLLSVGLGLAQDVPDLNAQLYRPPIDAESTLWTDDAFTAPDGHVLGRAFFHYANDPLIFRDTNGEEISLLSNVLQADVIGAYSVKNVRIGVDLPLMLIANGESVEGGGLGDIALDAKYTILNADAAPVGLGVGGRLTLPTATVAAPLGTAGLGGELQAIASQRIGAAVVAANLGTRFLPSTPLENVQWDDQFFYRFGGGHALSEGSGISLDLAGQISYAEGLSNPAASPAEFLLGGWYRLPADLLLRAGAGAGLNSGVGAPDARVVFSIAYEPEKIFDRDLDGILDLDDSCPDSPEDFDRYADDDGCPDPATTVYFIVEDSSGVMVDGVKTTVQTEHGPVEHGSTFELHIHPGDYTIAATADRYSLLETVISVPEADRHEVRLTLEPLFGSLRLRVLDTEGKKLSARVNVGADRTEIVDGAGELDVGTGAGTLVVRADGYKTQKLDVNIVAGQDTELSVVLEVARAVISLEKIEILEKVFFDTNKISIKPESFSLLDEIAVLLIENPAITLIRVDGHTDARGAASANRRLSQGRANSVQQYLIDKGVAADRLTSAGYGEDVPIETGNNEAAWEQNRRVEFVIVERQVPEGE